jgi:tRNA pseudouridine13 synthase
VRKTGANTEWVARRLAQCAGVPVSAVGYAGLKDRHAVTLQWFSIPRPPGDVPNWSPLAEEGIAVLDVHRHRRKLRRGALSANRFEILVRELAPSPLPGLTQRLDTLRTRGVPNYFGEQRFGRQESNLAQVSAMFAGRVRAHSRHRSGLWLSAARAQIFNELLAARVVRGDWDRPMVGDAIQLAGSRSYFVADSSDDALEARCAAMDVHPTGPLWGQGRPPACGEVGDLETTISAGFEDWCTGLAAAGLKQERRALRLPVADLTAECAPEGLRLWFRLPAGAYATAVLRELIEMAPVPSESD